MAKETKTAKLTEDVLQEQPLDQTQTPAPTQATPEEVNQASADLSDPALTNPDIMDPDVTDPTNEVPTDASTEVPTQEDPMFTPPAPGYVPAGWVKIEDLASAVAQATGDVTVAETAPDAQTPTTTPETETAPVNPSEAVTEPLVQQSEVPQQTQPQQPVQESVENTKERLTEDIDLANAGNTEESSSEGVSISSEDKLEESKKLKEEMILDGEGVAEPMKEDIFEDSVEEDTLEDTTEDLPEDEDDLDEDYEFPEDVEMDEEEEDFLTKITSFLDDVKEDAEDKMEDAEDEVEKAADSFENTSEFLRSLLDDDDNNDNLNDSDEDDFNDEEDDLEMGDSDDDFEDDSDEDDFDDEEEEDDMGEDAYDESYKNSRPHMREGSRYNSFLPAGSEHFAADDNIVKSYEESSAARRRAIANFRASLKENKVRDAQLRRRNSVPKNRFSEALRGEDLRDSYRNRESFKENNPNPNSWGNSNILNKYDESETLSWKELLNKGFLG